MARKSGTRFLFILGGGLVLVAICAAAYWLISSVLSPQRYNLILISLDTTRADHLGCYGHPFVKTPNIDAFAAESILFDDVTATAPTTLTSHTSLMTGTYPHTHGVPYNGFVVNEKNVMLAEVMRDAGYATGAVLGSFALESRFRFNQGFDTYSEEFDLIMIKDRVDQNERRAEKVTDRAIDFLEQNEDKNHFLFLHYFDPHCPYAPPPPYDRMYAAGRKPDAGSLPSIARATAAHQIRIAGEALGPKKMYSKGLTRELVTGATGEPMKTDSQIHASYCGEISYLDYHLGRLLDHLKRSGLYDKSIIVITGDHGENMWEHADFWNHGLWVYGTSVRVPLIIRLPEGKHGGTVISDPLSNIDIFPSIVELLELPEAQRAEGRSFVPALRGERLEPAAIFSEATQPVFHLESDREWRNLQKPQSIRVGKWKYIRTPYLEFEELYDIENDPGETTNLLDPAGLSPETSRLAEDLMKRLKKWQEGSVPLESHYDSSQLEETMERLKAMGYTGGR